MFHETAEMKGIAKRGTWFWGQIVCALLLALLAVGFVEGNTVGAQSSVPLLPATVSRQQADAAPVMEAFNGTFYVGWTGRNAAHNLNVMTYNPTTGSFGPARVLADSTLVGAGPSLVTFYGNLYVAWLGKDLHLNIGRYNPANPSVLANKVTLRETSPNAPALAAFNDRLYLSWRGMDGRLNIISSGNGRTFGSKVTYGMTIRTSPSLAGANMYLLVFWENMTASSHLVVGRYDPSQPGNLSAIVTMTSTSQFPVGVAQAGVPQPYARVAWRTVSDAHIHLGLFEGITTMQQYTTTTQTTLYGPTLFDGAYMIWTGTNAAQNVNVSRVHL